jgi:Sec-independent protein translocase protein TatA
MLNFIRRTIFSKSWWDKYYWIPTTFLVGILLWILSGGKESPLGNIFKRINKIEKDNKSNIEDIKSDSDTKDKEIQDKAKADKEKIQEETKETLAEIRKELDNESKAIAGDSGAINDELNSILDD